jgi:hypothetical protein
MKPTPSTTAATVTIVSDVWYDGPMVVESVEWPVHETVVHYGAVIEDPIVGSEIVLWDEPSYTIALVISSPVVQSDCCTCPVFINGEQVVSMGPIVSSESVLTLDSVLDESNVVASRPGWNLFRDGCHNGEMPEQISSRADRLIQRLKKLDGSVALFSHSHLGRVLAARWIGLSVEHAQHLLLNTASLSILYYEHARPDQPAIALWNSAPLERFADSSDSTARSIAPPYENAIQSWENEGGEISASLQKAWEDIS